MGDPVIQNKEKYIDNDVLKSDYNLLSREVEGYFSKLFVDSEALEDILDNSNIDYYSRITTLKINKSEVKCHEIYIEKRDMSKISDKIKDLLKKMFEMQKHEIELHNSDLKDDRDYAKLAESVSVLEINLYTSQHELFYRDNEIGRISEKMQNNWKKINEFKESNKSVFLLKLTNLYFLIYSQIKIITFIKMVKDYDEDVNAVLKFRNLLLEMYRQSLTINK